MRPRPLVSLGVLVACAGAANAAPVMPLLGSTAVLPTGEMSISERPNDSFTGGAGLGVETVVLVGFSGGAVVRPCATLRLGPLAGCIGLIAGDETKFNAAIDVFSYQHSGWEIAIGAGLHDGGTVRAAVPLTWAGVPKLIRVRLMSSFGGGDTVRLGAGVEADVW